MAGSTNACLSGSMKAAGGVAVAAHLGGFVAGFVLLPCSGKRESNYSRAGILCFFSQSLELLYIIIALNIFPPINLNPLARVKLKMEKAYQPSEVETRLYDNWIKDNVFWNS